MATKKPAAKKPAAKKSAAKSSTAKKPAAKKVVAKKTIAPTKEAAAKVEKDLGGDDKKAPSKAIKPGALIAEFLGTFLLAAAATMFSNTGVEYLLAVVVIVVIFAAISRAHLNPAVTFAAWINKKIHWRNAILFIVAQVLGAVLAFFSIQGLVNEQNATYADDGTRTETTLESKLVAQGIQQDTIDKAGGAEAWLSANGYDVATVAKQMGISVQYQVPALKSHKEMMAFWCELVGSIIFGLGAGYALIAARKKTLARGFAYGGAMVLALAIVGSTAVLNPAVAFSLGAYHAHIWPWVIYLVAPLIGVTIGFSLFAVIRKDTKSKTCDCDNDDCEC
jgi:glycerol uptake facilitator-like aquaporin